MTSDAYLRHPHVRREQIVFVADDDVWLASTGGGRAYRVSADRRPAQSPRLSPDGAMVAWTSRRDGANEVYVTNIDGGAMRQLTFWGQLRTVVRGWWSDTEVLVLSAAGEADRARSFAHAVPIDGGPSRRLPYGWALDLAAGPDGAMVLSTPMSGEPAYWKRYRGGTAAQLWLDVDGAGRYRRIFGDLVSPLVSPVWTVSSGGAQRIGFLSDHEGVSQLYSAPVGKRAPSTTRLHRHTNHEFYARHAASDGRQVVYATGGSLWLLDSLDPGVEPRSVEIRIGGARPGLRPWSVAKPTIDSVCPDRTGRASLVESRGTIQWVAHRDGPARAVADGSGVRRREPVLIGDTGRAAWVSDAGGDDAIEIGPVGERHGLGDPDRDGGGTGEPVTLVPAGRVGRVLAMAASPDGSRLVIASHDGRLLYIEVPLGEIGRAPRITEIARTDDGDIDGLVFSPDSRWLAWSHPGPEPLCQIRMVELARRRSPIIDVTPLRFTDTEPVFTTDGKHLAFLSVRSFDPVYDAFVFDLSFPNGCRPHIVPLAADTASPFDPMVGGRPFADGDQGATVVGGGSGSPGAAPPPLTRVDGEGLGSRIVPVPVEAARYSRLQAVAGGLVWLRQRLVGSLGDDLARPDDDSPPATLEHLDLATGKVQVLADAADDVVASGDGSHLVVVDKGAMRIVPADKPAGKPAGKEPADPDRIDVDLSRIRIEVTPRDEWRQMFHEAWRLMRDHFWRADMGGVDWEAARRRYEPLLARIGSHDDLVDVIWELHGELGTSHAYVMAPEDQGPAGRQGLLGADVAFIDGAWRVTRILPGESAERRARSPLMAPGVAMGEGDAIVAIDGRSTSALVNPGALLVGAADKPVELVVAPAGGGERRRVVVVPVADESPLRYQDWVGDRARYVHEQTEGRIGYLHVPDMMSGGWAQLHRDLRTEVGREGLIVDVRGNRGGHVSQLVVEKLARRIVGWARGRGYEPESYPTHARRGPMVAVCDMFAGSDGDIVNAAIQSLDIGTVVGTRTWGGVIGIDGRYNLIDGTVVTQPRYAFWFERFGWGVENHGVDPDVEVVATPEDRVAGVDRQLDAAITIVQRQLRKTPAMTPPDLPPI